MSDENFWERAPSPPEGTVNLPYKINPLANIDYRLSGFEQPKIVAYCTLNADCLAQLECLVLDCFESGWQPLGGVSVAYHADKHGFVCAQAMVKYSDG